MASSGYKKKPTFKRKSSGGGIRKKRKAKPLKPEEQMQQDFVKYLNEKWFDRGLVWCHACGNVKFKGGAAASIGKTNKKMGYWAGIPDLFIMYPSNGAPGLFLELKTPDGVVSKVQKITIAKLRKNKYRVEIPRSLDECKFYLEDYVRNGYEKKENTPTTKNEMSPFEKLFNRPARTTTPTASTSTTASHTTKKTKKPIKFGATTIGEVIELDDD